MSPLENSTSYITTATGSIDYAYYDKQARMARSVTFGEIMQALEGIVRRPRPRLSIPPSLLGSGPVANPCG